MLRADANWCEYWRLFGPLIVSVTLSLSEPIWNDKPAAFAVMRPIVSWLSVAANAVMGMMSNSMERESKTRDRTWALINSSCVCAAKVSTRMVLAVRRAFRFWMRNKIVFPWPIGNILKERFRNPLGAREEMSSDGGAALPPVASAADYSHSIVLGGFEEMS